jgi:isoquinoline 1-oxidoreductase alpha subunit
LHGAIVVGCTEFLQDSRCPQRNSWGVKYELDVNGVHHTVHVDPDVPLLWVIRDYLGLTGTKYGCGQSLCGACTVQVDGAAVRSCGIPISAAVGKTITTIEGLSPTGEHPLQKAWVEYDVPQCGYCQAGQLMTAAALLREKPRPTDEEIRQAMAGNICRCGTYVRMQRAIRQASAAVASKT